MKQVSKLKKTNTVSQFKVKHIAGPQNTGLIQKKATTNLFHSFPKNKGDVNLVSKSRFYSHSQNKLNKTASIANGNNNSNNNNDKPKFFLRQQQPSHSQKNKNFEKHSTEFPILRNNRREMHSSKPVRGDSGKNHNYYPNISQQKSAIELPLDNPVWMDNASPDPQPKPSWGPGSDSWIEFWNKYQDRDYLPVIVHAGQYWQGPNEVLTHQQRVTRLYRRCLRTVYNKIDLGFNSFHADEVATDIRMRFRANMHVTDPKQIAALVYAGEDEADLNRVHLPYVPPYRGNEYHRNLPAPEPLTRMEARVFWPDDPGKEDHTAFV